MKMKQGLIAICGHDLSFNGVERVWLEAKRRSTGKQVLHVQLSIPLEEVKHGE